MFHIDMGIDMLWRTQIAFFYQTYSLALINEIEGLGLPTQSSFLTIVLYILYMLEVATTEKQIVNYFQLIVST